MSGKGTPPLGAPSPPLAILAQYPFVDPKTGVLEPWALQALTRLQGGVFGQGGVADQVSSVVISGGGGGSSSTDITEAAVAAALQASAGVTPVPEAAVSSRLSAVETLAAQAFGALFRAGGAAAAAALVVEQNGTVVDAAAASINFTGPGSAVTEAGAHHVTINIVGSLPLVTGDLPGPVLIADPSGQCILVPLQ
jgi:hypothetical protein